MKTLSLVIDDVDAELCPDLLARLQAVVRRVRLTEGGYLVRRFGPDDWPGHDWRHFYERLMAKLFPHAWIYRGGHHLAVHASPPPEPERCWGEPGGSAGRCLFRILETPTPKKS